LMHDNTCYGVRVAHAESVFNLYAHNVVIASGGVGSLYAYHTNARTISADMQGMCLSHGIKLSDMEMMQFHPTAFVLGSAVRKQLLSESLRGEGACIVDEGGRRFVFDYHPDGELAPRDVVSRAIFDYKQKTHKEVYLDVSHFEKEQLIPISPAFHYSMGGIHTDLNGKVENVKHLYAVGEAAHTGVHGANRLASNSLLEGLVFSRRVALDVGLHVASSLPTRSFPNEEAILVQEGDKALKNELRQVMWSYAGIVRETKNLHKALKRVEEMLELPIGKLLRLRLLVSREIIASALKRQKSLGAHYMREDTHE